MISPDDVLRFWFGPKGVAGPFPDGFQSRWWKKDPAFDSEIRDRFGLTHGQAVAGKRYRWCETMPGRLALVIVIDQFSRNLYRYDPRAWANDGEAQRLVLEAIRAGTDAELPPQGRVFLYMPLMHAEDSELQTHSVARFTALGIENPSLATNTDYAEQHKVIVDRFGRFPHRNAILGRESTAEEVAFLREPGSSF